MGDREPAQRPARAWEAEPPQMARKCPPESISDVQRDRTVTDYHSDQSDRHNLSQRRARPALTVTAAVDQTVTEAQRRAVLSQSVTAVGRVVAVRHSEANSS